MSAIDKTALPLLKMFSGENKTLCEYRIIQNNVSSPVLDTHKRFLVYFVTDKQGLLRGPSVAVKPFEIVVGLGLEQSSPMIIKFNLYSKEDILSHIDHTF